MRLLRVAVSSSDVLYAVTASRIHLSRDGAATWTQIDGGLPPLQDLRDLASHPVHALTAFAATGSGAYSLNAFAAAAAGDDDVPVGPDPPPDPPDPDEPPVDPEPPVPLVTVLYPPYPNPTQGDVTLAFDLSAAARVDLGLYDVLGQPVRRLIHEERPPGAYTVAVKLDGVAPGVWLVRLRAGEATFVAKILVIR